MVAIHNDYRLEGVKMTFWLFTHQAGTWIKGEGLTDLEALKLCRQMATYLPTTKGGIR